MKLKSCNWLIMMALIGLSVACSTVKPDEQEGYLLKDVEIESDSKLVDESQLMPYIRQQATSRLSALLKFNKYKATVYDTLLARQTCDDLRTACRTWDT